MKRLPGLNKNKLGILKYKKLKDWKFNADVGQTCGMENYRISQPIRCTVIFSLGILEKNTEECILILVIYWKKTGLLHTKISNHNIIYSP